MVVRGGSPFRLINEVDDVDHDHDFETSDAKTQFDELGFHIGALPQFVVNDHDASKKWRARSVRCDPNSPILGELHVIKSGFAKWNLSYISENYDRSDRLRATGWHISTVAEDLMPHFFAYCQIGRCIGC
jgi:hypothetical protein